MSIDLNRIHHPEVKKAVTAWQNADKAAWYALFTTDAKLYDDGDPRDFKRFVEEACGHGRFTSIDQVNAEGTRLEGAFHTEQWGDFRTYFQFHVGSEGRFDRLDIGQAGR